MIRMGHLWAIMEKAARHGGILAIHAEDDDLVMYMYERLEREGRTDIAHMPLVHSAMSEDISFRRVLRLARYVEGAAVYFVHVSAGAGVEAIAEARGEGRAIYGETLHHYATFTAEAYLRPDGVMFHTYPSLKHEEDRQRLWAGLKNGTLSTVATDELCTPRAIKVRSRHVADATGGHVGVETRLPIIYTEGVSKRGMSLERFVAVTSTQRGEDPRPLSAQGRDRPGQRRGSRRFRSHCPAHASLRRPPRLRLQRVGRLGGARLAEPGDPARQDRGRERQARRSGRRRPTRARQACRGHPGRPHRVSARRGSAMAPDDHALS